VRYQWRRNGGNIPGATGSSYTIPEVGSEHAGVYTVEVFNGCSSATSAGAALTVKDPITITAQPVSLARLPGQAATFSVAATGTNLRYQWRGRDGGNIPGATGSSYTIPSVTAAHAGSYYVVVFNGCSTIDSARATLIVSGGSTGNESRFEIQSVPLTMTAGQSYPVSIRMRNAGVTSWTAANGYKLVSQRPQGNLTWGISGVDLPVSLAQVLPNGVAAFSFTVKAPSTPGTYIFEWRMAQNGVGFGDFSPDTTVTVVK
jgi:hypothetical protein